MTTPDDRFHIDASGSDLASVRDVLSFAYAGVDFRADALDEEFSFRYAAAGDSSMTVRALRFEGRLEGVVPAGDDYVVTWTSRGLGLLDTGRTPIETAPGRPQMWPTEAFEFRFEKWEQRLIQVNYRAVAEVLAERGLPSEGIRFDYRIDPSDSALTQWRNTVTLVSKTVLDRRASPILQKEMARIAAIALIEMYPVKPSDLPPDLLLPKNAHIRAAVEYAHEHIEQPITSTDLARIANVSLRALQQAFVRHLELSPNAYLRGLRLDKVHAELQRADPGTVSIAEVAARWGFAHAGRFAAAYAERFGCYPKETLAGA